MLGYKPNRHEGKITGQAAFGDAEKAPTFRQMFYGRHRFRYDLAGRCCTTPIAPDQPPKL
jgi:predicted NodU family carbamoyl transferase